MTYKLSAKSLATLDGVHPDLVRVVKRAIEITEQDFSVAEGLRSPARAKALAAGGTGIEASLHIRQPDGYGHAVDLWPYPLNWQDLAAFRRVAAAMFAAADELGILLQWGADWDTDGEINEPGEWDYPHYQIPPGWRRSSAKYAADRRRMARARGEAVIA